MSKNSIYGHKATLCCIYFICFMRFHANLVNGTINIEMASAMGHKSINLLCGYVFMFFTIN